MSKWKGERLSVEIYGTSHGEKIGVVGKGFPAFTVDEEELARFMKRRQGGQGMGSTPRKEEDKPEFLYVENGDFEAVIYNKQQRSGDYNDLYGKPRPSHADYCSFIKDGTLDYRGGGRFSARLTAPVCIAGGIAKQILEKKNIRVYAYLSAVGRVAGKSYKDGVTEEEIKTMAGFPSLTKGKEMTEEIENARMDGDSVGAVCECVVFGLPAGVGNDYFEGLEGDIARLLYAVPAVKGVEFGSGFELASMKGSQANDPFYYDGETVKTKTNHAGGINGGISNGMPLTMRIAFRPTPSIGKEQQTVDLIGKNNVTIKIAGRHDSCVAVRALPVVESMVCLALLDKGVTL